MITPLVSERDWRSRLDGLPQWQPPLAPTLVVVPHPDDEVLATGGLIGALREKGAVVTVAAVTDGDAAYENEPDLAARRVAEQTAALERLGVTGRHIHRLRLPDGAVADHEQRLADLLSPLVTPRTHIVAPWPQDFHPDHEACGRAAQAVAAATGTALTFWFFWTWHRGTLELVKNLHLTAMSLSERQLGAKQEALRCHASQLRHASGDPILPPDLLEPSARPYEVFLPA